MKSVHAPHLGRAVKLGGRLRPDPHAPMLRLSRYLKAAALPTPPATSDYSAAAASVIANVFDNDSLGDCVIAEAGHFTGVETGNAGDLFTYSDAQIIADYSAIGGYVPGDSSTDQGCDEVTALNYYTQHGYANGTKLLGYLAVDPTNQQEVMFAMWAFENLMFGIELPDAWITPFPSSSGFVWDVGTPDDQNGHCVGGCGHNATGIQIMTWGMIGTITYAAIAALCAASANGALYVRLTPDQLGKAMAKTPSGFAWADLISDFDAMGGSVPVPTPNNPPPPPPPPPAPGTPPTLAQAIAWAQAGVPNSFFTTSATAKNGVARSLTANWPASTSK